MALDMRRLMEMREHIIERVRTDPLAMRYLQKIGPYMDKHVRIPSITNVVDALGERMLTATLPLDPRVELFLVKDLGLEEQWNIRCWLSTMILDAEVFFWSEGIFDEAVELDLPPHIISPDILPHDIMYWTFSDALNEQVSGKQIDWMLVYRNPPDKDYPGGFTYVWPMTTEHPGNQGELEIVGQHIRTGTRYPEDMHGNIDQFLKMLAFINSPYVQSDGQPADRAIRREWTRSGKQGEPPLIRVVKLRAAPVHPVQHPGTGESGRHPGQTGHWYVRPHFRAQWYPSKQAHEVIWIAQQLRGDPSQPLKKRVYKVDR